MTTIRLIEEHEATGKNKQIFDFYRKAMPIGFIPNLNKAMAWKPDSHEALGRLRRHLYKVPGPLDPPLREMIAVVVSAMNACVY